MSDRDLRLNSVSRYSKESSRLVLEEHGHCEIPAGCGGVVLRWFNPLRAMPLEFWAYVNGEKEFTLDGKSLKSARPLVEYGEHVLTFVISGFDVKAGIFMFAAVDESKAKNKSSVTDEPVQRAEILSNDDGSWRYTLIPPSDDAWMRVGFDDTTWKPLAHRPVPEPTKVDAKSYWHDQLIKLGAKGLGIEKGTPITNMFHRPRSRIWIRRIFHLTPNVEEQPHDA